MSLPEPASTSARLPRGRRNIALGAAAAVTTASVLALPATAQAETVANVATAYAVSGPNLFATTPSPVAMAGTADGRYLFATDYDFDKVVIADTRTRNTVTTISGITKPSSLAMASDDSFVLIANHTTGTFTRMLTNGSTSGPNALGAGSKPIAVAINDARTFAYFASQGSNVVEEVRLSDNTVTRSLALGTTIPTAMAVSHSGGYLWIASNLSNQILKVDTSTLTVDTTFPASGPVSLAAAPDNSRLVYTSSTDVTRLYTIMMASGVRTNVVHTGSGRPLAVAIDPQSTFAYVGKYGSESVKVDLATGDTSLFAESGNPENAAFLFPSTGSDANTYAYAAQTSGLPLVKVAISPSAPTPVDGTRGDSQVALTWTTPTYPGAASITDYTVQYSTDSASWTTFTHAASVATAITVTGLTNGTPYYFRVAGVSAAGTGLFAYMTGTRTPATVPGAPTGITASTGPGQLTAGWTAPASNGGEAITDYVVEYSTNNTTWTPVSRTPSTSTSQIITGLTGGTPYYIRVAAVNAVGTGAWGSGGTWTAGTGGGGGGAPTDPTPPGGTPGDDPTPSLTATSAATPQATSAAPTARPSIANARVIYRMKPTGVWEVVPRFRKAAKAIPANALFTAVRSPILGQSKNIPAALTRSKALATVHVGHAHPTVLKGKLWRGRARIIVNW